MAWEKRARGGRYYTRSVKTGGRVRRMYLGAGEAAMLIARLEDMRRKERERSRADERAELQRHRQFEAPLLEFYELTDLCMRAVLLASGYRQHHRGEWRKQRGQ